jgi:hypothetical protein
VDCGGDTCDPCSLGATCDTEADCASNLCRARRCVAPASCEDGVRNNGETAIDCGGAECSPCKDGKTCDRSSDCESLLCSAGTCAVPECGDGVTQTQNDEECDDRIESSACNANCTVSRCGDGVVNATAGEFCEPEGTVRVYSRCNDACTYGSGLDGTFGTEWEELAALPSATYATALQSFHYSGQPFIYELRNNRRYRVATDAWDSTWAENPVALPADLVGSDWANAAVSATALWVPRNSKMHRFDLETEEWTVAAEMIPNGTDQLTAAVFDGEGNIWYHGPTTTTLVRYTPSTKEFEEFEHDSASVYETRFAYDPVTNQILFASYYGTDRFFIFDPNKGEFTYSSSSPGGDLRDITCQDRAGGVYTGATDLSTMYRYDVAADTWTDLPPLPAPHDYWSTCVVSEDGYLYYSTLVSTTLELYRLPLGKH